MSAGGGEEPPASPGSRAQVQRSSVPFPFSTHPLASPRLNRGSLFDRFIVRWDPYMDVIQPYLFDHEPYQVMTEPLSSYFISSGHNSYLTADQLVGAAGVKTIVQVRTGGRMGVAPSRMVLIHASMLQSLHGGCRLIELDCYNGGPQGPICKHGGTATRPVLFKVRNGEESPD